jgi:hypothetical protein
MFATRMANIVGRRNTVSTSNTTVPAQLEGGFRLVVFSAEGARVDLGMVEELEVVRVRRV